MLNIEDPVEAARITPLFRLAFRPFFLGGSIFSFVALFLWGGSWLVAMKWSPYGGWVWWHAHEMIFGFVVAIMSGFLLTAVKNWTGQPGLSGWPLAGLFILWLSSRLLLLYPVGAIESLIPWLDLSFLPVTAWIMGRMVWRARQMQQMIFVVILLMLAVVNAEMHWALIEREPLLAREASHSAVFLIIMLMVVLGGRVIPFFTANGTGKPALPALPIIEKLSLGLVAALVLLQISGFRHLMPGLVLGGLYLFAALVHLLRFLRWRPWTTIRHPLLWSLHLAYLSIVLGFFVSALNYVAANADWFSWTGLSYTTTLHSFTVGGAGLLILSMMSRVSLGHTGRPLKVSHWMALGFVCVLAAGVLRVWISLLFADASHYLIYIASIGLWLLGYGLFVVFYLPVLTSARIDGRPG